MSKMTAKIGGGSRVQSVDLLRGFVMLLVALDIMRYFLFAGFGEPTNLDGTTAPLFFTRWITHYFAPGFLLLTGVGAYLKGRQGFSKKALSKFLLTRGIFVILLEIIVVGFLWKFQFNLFPIFFQFIWILGASMIILAGLIHLPVLVIVGLAVAVIFGHNLLDHFSFGHGFWPNLFNGILHREAAICADICKGRSDTFYAFISYPILPWFAVMALGYALGHLYDHPQEKRKKVLLWGGLGTMALFLIVRFFNGYGNPDPWEPHGNVLWTLLSFLNTEKYPPSLSYLLMTLGPLFLLLYAFEGVKGKFSKVIQVYGRVPLYFYILQFLFAHLLAFILGIAQGYRMEEFLRPLWQFPDGFGVGLLWVYVAFLAELALMYPLCEWYSDLRAKGKYKILDYF